MPVKTDSKSVGLQPVADREEVAVGSEGAAHHAGGTHGR